MKLVVPSDRLTVIEARFNVRPGEALYIRGQGDGLNWDKGQRLNCGFGGGWIWTTNKAQGKVRFKLLLNDKIWAQGRRMVVKAGGLIEVAPVFRLGEPVS